MKFWKSASAVARLRLAARQFVRGVCEDVRENILDPLAVSLRQRGILPKNLAPARGTLRATHHRKTSTEKPVIFASYCVDEKWIGSHRYCGGEKSLNNLVNLLRRHGYEAYMVSLDGTHADWLLEHAPYISLEEFRKKSSERPARCVTSWIDAHAFLAACGPFYFWDHELATTAGYQFPSLAARMREGRILRTAAFNRAIQAWYMTTFGNPSTLIRSLVDDRHWSPDETRRIPSRVGYMIEGPHTEQLVSDLEAHTKARGLDLEFHRIAGVEAEVLRQMQTCGVFLVTNTGKSQLWGEGGPLGPHESMSCGTVPIGFDLNGPWETIQQNYNGIIVPSGRPDLMAEALSGIYLVPGRLETMSANALGIIQTSHTMESRWTAVCEFLDLDPD